MLNVRGAQLFEVTMAKDYDVVSDHEGGSLQRLFLVVGYALQVN